MQSYIDKEYHYFQIIKDKFSSENCEIPISILKDESLFQYYFSLQSAPKLESCKRDLEKRLRALNPPKIKRSDFNQVITSPYVAASSELTDCFDLRSLLNKDYKISNKVCREIGVKKELILEFLDDLVDLLNDDNCPKELFDIFYSLFCLSLPRMISNGRYSFFKRVNTENTSKVQNALNNYKTYKKAGCFIEVVK